MQNADPAIREVLHQNMEVADELHSVAHELEVVHVVLSTTVSDQAANPDLRAAVDRVAVIEKKLDHAAETLDDSNERLRGISPPPGRTP